MSGPGPADRSGRTVPVPRVRPPSPPSPSGPSVAAVEAVRVELAALPAPAVPPQYAARWAGALAAEAARPPAGAAGRAGFRPVGSASHPVVPAPRPAGPGPGPAGPPSRPGRRRRRPALLVAAVAGVLALAVPLWPGAQHTAPTAGGDLAATARTALGTADAGPFTDAGRRGACLREVRAPGVDPAAALLGARPVELGGRAGVLLVLAAAERRVLHVVVVDPGCGPDGGTLLASTSVAGR